MTDAPKNINITFSLLKHDLQRTDQRNSMDPCPHVPIQYSCKLLGPWKARELDQNVERSAHAALMEYSFGSAVTEFLALIVFQTCKELCRHHHVPASKPFESDLNDPIERHTERMCHCLKP
jgi:hypothetical protein